MARVTPIVFLPGAAGRASFWQPVADRLADLGPVHLVGYPGFGGLPPDPGIRSLDDLYHRVVAGLPPGPCHVVAQSMGGVLAVRMAAERPERVSRLILVATSGGVDVARLAAEDWRRDDRASLPDVPTWFADDRTDLSDRLGAIRARTLLLWTDTDPVSPPSVARHLARLIPDARIEIVPGGTHSVASERPDEVAALIRAHLAAGTAGDLGQYWKRVARGRDFRIQAVAGGGRDQAIGLARDAISASRGDILDFKMFSNLSLCLIVEVAGERVPALAGALAALGWGVEVDPAPEVLAGRAGEPLQGTVQLTFPEGDGRLEIPTPAVPG